MNIHGGNIAKEEMQKYLAYYYDETMRMIKIRDTRQLHPQQKSFLD